MTDYFFSREPLLLRRAAAVFHHKIERLRHLRGGGAPPRIVLVAPPQRTDQRAHRRVPTVQKFGRNRRSDADSEVPKHFFFAQAMVRFPSREDVKEDSPHGPNVNFFGEYFLADLLGRKEHRRPPFPSEPAQARIGCGIPLRQNFRIVEIADPEPHREFFLSVAQSDAAGTALGKYHHVIRFEILVYESHRKDAAVAAIIFFPPGRIITPQKSVGGGGAPAVQISDGPGNVEGKSQFLSG
mmetsp:Transcript_26938/g.53803  ORF Transcript_26938/g.53803 Transcript_26938/m.53803 type:complete len:240 (+) Transcript_26938:56-775(+)